MAPNAHTQFPIRKSVLQYLIRENHSEGDKARLREAMQVDGWKENHYLPGGWMFKTRKAWKRDSEHGYFMLISSEGANFSYFLAATEYMKTSLTYTEHGVEDNTC